MKKEMKKIIKLLEEIRDTLKNEFYYRQFRITAGPYISGRVFHF